jgi:hypothetical protein
MIPDFDADAAPADAGANKFFRIIQHNRKESIRPRQ